VGGGTPVWWRPSRQEEGRPGPVVREGAQEAAEATAVFQGATSGSPRRGRRNYAPLLEGTNLPKEEIVIEPYSKDDFYNKVTQSVAGLVGQAADGDLCESFPWRRFCG